MSGAGTDDMRDAVAALWRRFAGNVQARLDLLDRAAAAWPDADPALRAEARTAVHQLAGSLGTYGLRRAGLHASGIDRALAAGGDLRAADVARLRDLIAAEAP